MAILNNIKHSIKTDLTNLDAVTAPRRRGDNIKHSIKTDLTNRKVNNIDALLVLMSKGMNSRMELIDGLYAWRGGGKGYLFNKREATRLEGADRSKGKVTYYKRISKATYALTEGGLQRLAFLGLA